MITCYCSPPTYPLHPAFVYRILDIGHIVKKYQDVNGNGVFHLHNRKNVV